MLILMYFLFKLEMNLCAAHDTYKVHREQDSIGHIEIIQVA